MKPQQLYENDFYAWALSQAEALRRLPPQEGVDLEHVAEEIEDLGSEQLRAVTSHLVNLLAHLLKAAYSRNPHVLGHWRHECFAFQRNARTRFTNAMRHRIDLADLFLDARREAVVSFQDANEPVPMLPSACLFTLDELLDRNFDFDAAVIRLRALSQA